MKKYLLPKDGTFYKANLHCHSTCSDGRFTPEKLKEIYKEHGYSILAYSDHNVLISHEELKDSTFLPITAVEINLKCYHHYIFHNKYGRSAPTYHLNFFSKNEKATKMPFFIRTYSVRNANYLIRAFKRRGFLAQYNHPRWSFQSVKNFTRLRGLWSFEILNYGCETELFDGHADYEYEYYIRHGKLRKSKMPVPVADDDNHNGFGESGPQCDSFGGWTMIKAPELTYDAVMTAMQKGYLYASSGPEIKSLYVENGVMKIKTSPVKGIAFLTTTRSRQVFLSDNCDITHAEFELDPKKYNYVRIELKDDKGGRAWTRAYSLKEMLKND